MQFFWNAPILFWTFELLIESKKHDFFECLERNCSFLEANLMKNRFFQDLTQHYSRNFLEYSSIIPALFQEFPGIFQHYSRNNPGISQIIPGIFQDYSRNIPALFQEYSSIMPGIFQEYSSIIPCIFQEYSSIIPGLLPGECWNNARKMLE